MSKKGKAEVHKIKTILDTYNDMRAIVHESPEIPFHVWCCFWESRPELYIDPYGIQILGDNNSVDSFRIAIEWFAEQFGGKVKWSKK